MRSLSLKFLRYLGVIRLYFTDNSSFFIHAAGSRDEKGSRWTEWRE